MVSDIIDRALAQDDGYAVNDLVSDIECVEPAENRESGGHQVPDDAFTVRDTMHALEDHYANSAEIAPDMVNLQDWGTLHRVMDEAAMSGYLERIEYGEDVLAQGESRMYHKVAFYRPI